MQKCTLSHSCGWIQLKAAHFRCLLELGRTEETWSFISVRIRVSFQSCKRRTTVSCSSVGFISSGWHFSIQRLFSPCNWTHMTRFSMRSLNLAHSTLSIRYVALRILRITTKRSAGSSIGFQPTLQKTHNSHHNQKCFFFHWHVFFTHL